MPMPLPKFPPNYLFVVTTQTLSPQYFVKRNTSKTKTIYEVQDGDVIPETLVMVSRTDNMLLILKEKSWCW